MIVLEKKLIWLTVALVVGVAAAPLLASEKPGIQEGWSTTVPLQELIATEQHATKIQRLRDARNAWVESREADAAQLCKAMDAFRKNPTKTAEAELVRVNVHVITHQWEVLDEFFAAAQAVEQDINAMIPQVGHQGQELADAVDSLAEEIEGANRSAARLIENLRRIARQTGIEIKPEQALEPELADAIVEADQWIELEQFRANIAQAERRFTTGEREALDSAVNALASFRTELHRRMATARRKQRQLAMVAESQKRMIARGIFTDAVVDRVRRLGDAGLEDVPEGEILFTHIDRNPAKGLEAPSSHDDAVRLVLRKWAGNEHAEPEPAGQRSAVRAAEVGEDGNVSSMGAQTTSFESR